MLRTVGAYLLPLLMIAGAGCGRDTHSRYELDANQRRLLTSMRADLDARQVEWRSALPERQRLGAIVRNAGARYERARSEYAQQRRSLTETHDGEVVRAFMKAARRALNDERERGRPAQMAYGEVLDQIFGLRLEINELQLKIQRIEGFWETDPDIKALWDHKRRDQALQRLLVRDAYEELGEDSEDASCRVNHVVSCPQRDGPPMVAVFKAEGWDGEEEPGRAMGHMILFMSTGSYVPYYEAASVIEPTGVVRDLNADGIIDIADTILCGGGDGDDYYQLYVLPVTPEQTDSLQVWCRETDDMLQNEIECGFEAADPDGDGVHDIVIGLRAEDGSIEERVRYLWSAAAGRWVGPSGSTTGDFYRFDPDADEDAQVSAFVNKRTVRDVDR